MPYLNLWRLIIECKKDKILAPVHLGKKNRVLSIENEAFEIPLQFAYTC